MSYFVLADCNNFYASCEGIFNPKLEGLPVVVLSNNDGCIIARSQEAKNLGLKMGEPYFKVKQFCMAKKVIVFSSNYTLYGNISWRVMSLLASAAEEIEYYSIDEAFLQYDKSVSASVLFDSCLELKRKVKKWVGIPISLGIAPTKTLAKVANSLAKKHKLGVFSLIDVETRQEILKTYPIEDVWGIGSQLSKRLYAMGIYTAFDFIQSDPLLIRKKMGVVGERMHFELKGISCLKLEEPTAKKSITCSRSFGKIVTESSELEQALSSFVNTACIKLREQKGYASAMTVFLESVLDAKLGTRNYFSTTIKLPLPTNYTPDLITMAKKGMQTLFKKHQKYKKCGVVLFDLISEDLFIPDLFVGETAKKAKIMETITAINQRFGKNTCVYAAMGTQATWKMRSDNCSNHFTTDWDNLKVVKA